MSTTDQTHAYDTPTKRRRPLHGHVGRDREVEVLAVGVVSAVAMRAVSFVRRRNLEALALIDGEAHLARTAVVVADPGDAVCPVTSTPDPSQRRRQRPTGSIYFQAWTLPAGHEATEAPCGVPRSRRYPRHGYSHLASGPQQS